MTDYLQSYQFFNTRHPVTSLRITPAGGHAEISVWVKHALSGSLVLRKNEVLEMLQILLINGLEISEEFRTCLQE